MTVGVNAQEVSSKDKVGDLGETSTSDIRGRDPIRGDLMYWARSGGMEGMRSGGELLVEAGGRLA